MKIKHPYILSILCTGLFSTSASATLIASDSFVTTGGDAYNVDRIYGQSPTDGTSGFDGATTWGGGFNTGDIQVNASGLTSSLSVGTGGSVLASNGSDRNVYRAFDSFSPTDTTYYFSALFQVPNSGEATTKGAVGIASASSGNTADPVNGVMIGTNAKSAGTGDNTFSLWVDGNELEMTGTYTDGTTYFGLIEINNSSSGNDTITANIYSASATDFSSSLGTATTSAYDISSELVGFEIHKDYALSNSLQYDELRFGTELSDVSTIPEPSSIMMLVMGFGLVGFMVRRRK